MGSQPHAPRRARVRTRTCQAATVPSAGAAVQNARAAGRAWAGRGLGYTGGVPGLRLLTLAPRIDERAGVLRARTSLLLTLVTMGAIFRQVIVDKRSSYVVIERRLFWLFSSKRVIPFRMIRRIAYDYQSTATSLRQSLDGPAVGDEVEQFEVALVVCTRTDVPESHMHLHEEHVPLVRFQGEGQSPGLRLAIDLQGQQEMLSRDFVERLRALTGIGFGFELAQLSDGAGRAWQCSACSRPGPPRPGRCYYCGAALEVARG
jgi:hypothetical protein